MMTPEEVIYLMYGLSHLVFWPAAILYFMRRHHEPIRSRGWRLSLLQGFALIFAVSLIVAGENIPSCFPKLLQYVTTIPISGYPYLLRGFLVWYNYHFQTGMINHVADLRKTSFHESSDALSIRSQKKFYRWLAGKRWAVSDKFQIFGWLLNVLFFFGLTVLVYFLDTFLDPEAITNPSSSSTKHNRCFQTSTLPIVLTQFVMISIMISFLGLALTRVSEGLSMRLELFLVLTFGSIFFSLWLADALTPLPELITKDFWVHFVFIGFSFNSLWMPIIQSLKMQRILGRERSGFQSEMTQGVDDVLLLVLDEPILEKAFESFAIASWCVENLVFYRAVERYQKLDLPKEQLQVEADKIWKSFFDAGSFCEMNVDAVTKEKIFEDMQADHITPNLFHDAQKAAFNILRYSIFPLFKLSSECSQALQKLGVSNLQDFATKKKESA